MKKISVTGWVPKELTMKEILSDCELEPGGVKTSMEYGVFARRSDLYKKVRITVTMDVEDVP